MPAAWRDRFNVTKPLARLRIIIVCKDCPWRMVTSSCAAVAKLSLSCRSPGLAVGQGSHFYVCPNVAQFIDSCFMAGWLL